ncbi:type IV pilin [Methanolacinia paynteri]|uniref:type IV pilin n=1 Tax=Methanolacinia paynteri TaxID=230356 RepID=UPI00064E5BF9|nr:type IV pilin N-terminal domain-containing protein [Methanolacinia paynteri]
MTPFKKNPDAVSPVVGVMLMLTLVIILAAVISGFAGGIAGSSNSGSLIEITAQTKIINSGNNDTSRFEIDIISVNDPVSTKDLKLKTSWKSYDDAGNLVLHENSSMPGTKNFNYIKSGVSPIGAGPGLPQWDGTYENISTNMSFGNYAIMAGTKMVAYPSTYYLNGEYTDNQYTDCMQAILGEGWNNLSSGDVVNVMLIHVPSGRIIYDEDVNVNLT